MLNEPKLDQKLWFLQKSCCSEKHYLFYNPHTFFGRMGAWCPTHKHSYCVSKHEIDTCSKEATYWIRGFLRGNEPSYPTDNSGDLLPEEDPRIKEWRAAIALFVETGVWAVGRICNRCGEKLLPSEPVGFTCENCRSAET